MFPAGNYTGRFSRAYESELQAACTAYVENESLYAVIVDRLLVAAREYYNGK